MMGLGLGHGGEVGKEGERGSSPEKEVEGGKERERGGDGITD